jgi:hypothetical protein
MGRVDFNTHQRFFEVIQDLLAGDVGVPCMMSGHRVTRSQPSSWLVITLKISGVVGFLDGMSDRDILDRLRKDTHSRMRLDRV